MHSLSRALLTLTVLVWPVAAAALPPSSVTEIEATSENGAIQVRWKAAEGDDITLYRVYYSGESILENNGDYDDYEETKGPVTEHVLEAKPETDAVFISVIAVNGAGEESPTFEEEARVELRAGEEPVDEPEPEEEPKTAPASPDVGTPLQNTAPVAAPTGSVDRNFRLLSAQPVSATGIVLSFSHTVLIFPDEASFAFSIENASGATLPVLRFELQDKTVTIHTPPQERGVQYLVKVTPVVHGTAADGQQLNIGASSNTATFVGHASGVAPSTNAQTPGSAVRGLTLKSTARPDGLYDVEVSWQPPASAERLSSYSIYQSRDGGKTYGSPQSVSAATQTIRIAGVPQGDFGVAVQGVRPDGTTTQNLFQSITLPRLTVNGGVAGGTVAGGAASSKATVAGAQTSSKATTSVTTKTSTTTTAQITTKGGKPLTESGAGTVGVILVAGAAAGWYAMVRRKVARA